MAEGPPPAHLTTPIAPDPSDPLNWRETQRLQQLAQWEGRQFDPDDPYNWKGIAAAQAAAGGATPPPTNPAPGVTPVVTPVTNPANPAAPTGPSAAEIRNRDLFSQISQVLTEAGLGNLFTVNPDGSPGGALWTQITSGLDNQAALMLWFENTPEFQQRFPVIAQARQRDASGQMGAVPTPAQVLAYEREVGQQLRLAGLPSFMYEDRNYVQNLMANDLSADEVEARLGQAWTLVRNSDPAVLNQFTEFFGIQGDAAMAAFFLDPDRTLASIDRVARTAYTAGMGDTLGINLSREVADRIAGLPTTAGGIWQDLTAAARFDVPGGVLDEGFTETLDLSMDDVIDSTFFGDGEAANAIERRILERQANSRSSMGGAAITQRGAVGVGGG